MTKPHGRFDFVLLHGLLGAVLRYTDFQDDLFRLNVAWADLHTTALPDDDDHTRRRSGPLSRQAEDRSVPAARLEVRINRLDSALRAQLRTPSINDRDRSPRSRLLRGTLLPRFENYLGKVDSRFARQSS